MQIGTTLICHPAVNKVLPPLNETTEDQRVTAKESGVQVSTGHSAMQGMMV
jgi:hypothetical protein